MVFRRNHIPWNKGLKSEFKGKIYEEIYGKKKAKLIKEKMSKNHANMKDKNNPLVLKKIMEVS